MLTMAYMFLKDGKGVAAGWHNSEGRLVSGRQGGRDQRNQGAGGARGGRARRDHAGCEFISDWIRGRAEEDISAYQQKPKDVEFSFVKQL